MARSLGHQPFALRGNLRALRGNLALEAHDPPLARHDARAQRDALSFGTTDDAGGARRGGRLHARRGEHQAVS